MEIVRHSYHCKKGKLKKKHLNYYDCANKLTGLKKENEWLKEANSQSLQQTLKDLDTAYDFTPARRLVITVDISTKI